MKPDGSFADDHRQIAIGQPQDAKEKNYATPTKSTSLVIDTSANESNGSSEKVQTPSSARSSSSAVLPTFSKLQRWRIEKGNRKKFRESPKAVDSAETMSQEDIKRDVADSRRQARYRDKSFREDAKSPSDDSSANWMVKR